MDYEVSLSADEVKVFNSPLVALEDLKLKLHYKIHKDGHNQNHYITQSTNIGKGLKMTAVYSEERKQHFDQLGGTE